MVNIIQQSQLKKSRINFLDKMQNERKNINQIVSILSSFPLVQFGCWRILIRHWKTILKQLSILSHKSQVLSSLLSTIVCHKQPKKWWICKYLKGWFYFSTSIHTYHKSYIFIFDPNMASKIYWPKLRWIMNYQGSQCSFFYSCISRVK